MTILTLFTALSFLGTGPDKLVVHEWGTFTVLQDETGRALPGVNVNEETLPGFVHRLDRGLVPDFTSEENLFLPAWATGMPDSSQRLRWVYKLMPEVEQFASRRANQLSGGQQKMTALARALMAGKRLLLLDEPFEGLAPALARRLAEVLSNLKDEGMSVLLAESNEKHVADLLDSVNVIERGSIQPH